MYNKTWMHNPVLPSVINFNVEIKDFLRRMRKKIHLYKNCRLKFTISSFHFPARYKETKHVYGPSSTLLRVKQCVFCCRENPSVPPSGAPYECVCVCVGFGIYDTGMVLQWVHFVKISAQRKFAIPAR